MPDVYGDPQMGEWLTGFSPTGNTNIKNDGYEPEIAQAYKDMRMKLGKELENRKLSSRVFESAAEAKRNLEARS